MTGCHAVNDASALLAAIRAAPDDDAPRLVYADWLDEHGEMERAEFIRVQCELAVRESAELRRREVALLDSHHDAFAGACAALGLRFKFSRGFIVGLGHTGLFMHTGGTNWANSMLRFWPDGVVIDSTSTTLPESISTHFRRDNSLSAQGRYLLSGYAYPASIRFTCASAEGSVDFRGVLECAALHLDVHSRITGRHLRQRYTHIHVDGFDSFTET